MLCTPATHQARRKSGVLAVSSIHIYRSVNLAYRACARLDGRGCLARALQRRFANLTPWALVGARWELVASSSLLVLLPDLYCMPDRVPERASICLFCFAESSTCPRYLLCTSKRVYDLSGQEVVLGKLKIYVRLRTRVTILCTARCKCIGSRESSFPHSARWTNQCGVYWGGPAIDDPQNVVWHKTAICTRKRSLLFLKARQFVIKLGGQKSSSYRMAGSKVELNFFLTLVLDHGWRV